MPTSKNFRSINNEIYETRDEKGTLAKLTPGELRAFRALKLLDRRKGFEYWWMDVDEDNQAEIFAELAQELEKE